VVLAFALAGCGNARPETSRVATPNGDDDLEKRPFSDVEKAQSKGKLGGVWVACYRPFQPRGDAATDLARLIAACGKPTGLAPVTPIRTGEVQHAEDPAERFVFRARAGHCYRLFAIGAPGVTDLDVAVLDPRGKLVASDLSHDRLSVVPARGPLCFDQEGVSTIEVSVASGGGAYVVQVLGDEGG
jgi:hypothetical protein